MQLIGMVRHGTCVHTRLQLNDLYDGELRAPTEARVRRHLAGCHLCFRALARLETTIADIGRLRLLATPELAGLRDRIERRIAESPADDAGSGGGVG